METVIKSVNEHLEIKCVKEVNLEWKNKFNAIINKQAIKNWCKDNHIFEVNISPRDGRFFVEVKELAEHCKVKNINEARARCRELIAFVNDLPEVDSTIEDDNKSKEQSKEEIVDFVTDVLVGLHKKEINGAILMTSVGPIGLPCGKISHEVLTQMFEIWLDKYGNK